jgi:hypothetical protein
MQHAALTTSFSSVQQQHRLWARRSSVFTHHTPIGTAHRRRTATVGRSSTAHGEGANPWEAPGYQGALVSTLPIDQQRLAFALIVAALGAGTVAASAAGGALAPHLPAFLQVTRSSWFPLGPIFAAAGVGGVVAEPQRGCIVSGIQAGGATVCLTMLVCFAGVAHFTEEAGFKAMYPHQGAWGLWYLPGGCG